MTHIARGSKARGTYNEDFSYKAELPNGCVMIVGDFSPSSFTDLDHMAEDELKQILDIQSLAAAPPPLLLTQLAMQFNNRLLDYKSKWDMSFQCCAIFAAIVDQLLYYLPVGDCRISVQRGDTLWLLNGSIWMDAKGKPLPPMIVSEQEMKRGYDDDAPSQVLGVMELNLTPAQLAAPFSLEPTDTVLLYSDGIDKFISPAQLLTIVLEHRNTPPEEIISYALSEVLARQGDDDRTLLIATGPHSSATREAAAAELQQAISEQRAQASTLQEAVAEQQSQATQLAKTVKEQERIAAQVQTLNDRMQSLDKLTDYIEVIDKNTRIIYQSLQGLPNVATIQQAVTSMRAQHSSPQLEQLSEKLDEVIELMRSHNGDPQERQLSSSIITRHREEDKSATTGSSTGAAGQSSQQKGGKRDARSVNDQAITSKEAETFATVPLSLERLKSDTSFREGIIHVTDDNFELIDEIEIPTSRLRAKDLTQSDLFLTAPLGAPPGTLTAIYLYLRHLRSLYTAENGEQLQTWVLSQPLEQVQQLTPSLLFRLRNWHLDLREYRRTADASIEAENIADEERRVTKEIFSDGKTIHHSKGINLALPFPAHDPTSSAKKGQSSLWLLHSPIGILLFSIIFFWVGYLVRYAFEGSAAPTTPSTVSNQNERRADGARPWRIEYASDGRTMFITNGAERQPLGMTLPPFREEEFSQLFSAMTFKDRNDAIEKLAAQASDKNASLTNPQAPNGYAFYVVSNSGDDKNCAKLLQQINKVELRGVPVNMTLDELKKYNPGLRCEALVTGNMVLGKSKLWTPSAR